MISTIPDYLPHIQLTHEWTLRAKCRGMAVERFELTRVAHMDRAAVAKRLCRGCPVMAECALDTIRRGNSGLVRAGIDFPGNALRRNHSGEWSEKSKQLMEIADTLDNSLAEVAA